MIAPYFEELSKKHAGVNFIKIDVDDSPDVASSKNIRSVPTFFVYDKNAKQLSTFSGADKKTLQESVEKLVV